jgi:hypothetical protein
VRRGFGMTKGKTWLMVVFFGMILGSTPALAGPCGMSARGDGYEQLDRGFHGLYDLDFAGAEKTFVAWQAQQPRNPLGPASRASGYLFQEFERLGVLKAEIFTDNQRFEQRERLAPSPKLKARFDQEVAVADRLADEMLAQNPQSTDALLAKTLVNGLRADYAALIEKRNMASLSHTKEARRWAERLLRADATCNDAYLAIGAENYLVAIKPAVVRWFARFAGARANREEGIRELTFTAQNGRFLKPLAKLLLVLSAQRDHDPATARRLLAALLQEFPNNPLYRAELGKLDSGSKEPGNSNGTDKD